MNQTYVPTPLVAQQNNNMGSAQQTQQVVTQPTTPPETQQLFTQEQVNSIVAGRVNALNQKVNDLSGQLSQATALSNSYLSQLQEYQNREVLTNKGIPTQFQDYVAFEASKLAINGKTFEEAVEEFKTSHTGLFTQPSVVAPGSVQLPQTPVVGQQAGGVSAPTPMNAPQTQQTLGQIAQPNQGTGVAPQTGSHQNMASLQVGQAVYPQVPQQAQNNGKMVMINPSVQPIQHVVTGGIGGNLNPNGDTFDLDAFLKEKTSSFRRF